MDTAPAGDTAGSGDAGLGKPTCATCLHWQAPHDYETRIEAYEKAGMAADLKGSCWRYPQPVAKSKDARCGEHPELVAQRDADLALKLATAISAAQRGEIGDKRGR